MIVGRVSLLVGKAVAIKPDGSSRELSLGDQIESDELISVAAGGKILIAANNGEEIALSANETWVASSHTTENQTKDESNSAIDPSVATQFDLNTPEGLQAAVDAGYDLAELLKLLESTAAGPNAGVSTGLGNNEGSSFVRIERGSELERTGGVVTNRLETIKQRVAQFGEPLDPEQIINLPSAILGQVPLVSIPENQDGVINKQELSDGVLVVVLPPIGALPGDIVTVTVISISSGEVVDISVVVPAIYVAGNSVEIVIPSSVLINDGAYNVTVAVTDNLGNSSSSSLPVLITIDNTAPGDDGTGVFLAPTVSIPENSNGGINEQELGNGVNVIVTPPQGTSPNDIVIVRITREGEEEIIEVRINIPESFTPGSSVDVLVSSGSFPVDGLYNVAVLIEDNSGNQSTTSIITPVVIDTSVSQILGVSLPEDGGDGLTTSDLANGSTPVNLQLPVGSEEGDEIVLAITKPDGSIEEISYLVTAQDIAEGSAVIDVPSSSFSPDGDYSLVAMVTDQAGNVSAPSDPVGTIVETSIPSISVVSLPEDSGNGLSADDLADGSTPVNLQLPAGSKEGYEIVLKITKPDGSIEEISYTVTAQDIATGLSVIEVQSSSFKPDGEYSLVAMMLDPAGKESDSSTPLTTIVDTSVSQISVISLPEDGGDGLTASDLADGSTPVNLQLPVGIEEGDEIVLAITKPDGSIEEISYSVTTQDIAEGLTVIDVPSSYFSPDGEYLLVAKVTDQAGNVSAPSDPVRTIVGTSIPSITVVSLPEDDGNGLSADDLEDGDTPVHLQLPAGSKEGNEIVLEISKPDGSINEISYSITRQDIASGLSVVRVQASNFSPDGEYSIIAKVIDPDGKESEPSKPITTVVDTKVSKIIQISLIEDGGNGISADELSDGATPLNVQLPSGSEEGDKIVLAITKPDGSIKEINYTITEQDIIDGESVINIPSSLLSPDGNYSIVAKMIDLAGNVSEPSSPITTNVDTFVEDPLGATSNTIGDVTETVNGAETREGSDGYINKAELEDDSLPSVAVIPNGAVAGDKVVVAVSGPNDVEFFVEKVLTSTDITNGKVSVELAGSNK